MRKNKQKEVDLTKFLGSIDYWSSLCPENHVVQQMINNTHSLLYYIFNGYPKGCEYRIKNDMLNAIKYLGIEAELVPVECFKQISLDLVEKVKTRYLEVFGTEAAA